MSVKTANTVTTLQKQLPAEQTDALRVLKTFQKLDNEFPLQYAICLLEIAMHEGMSLTELSDKAGMALSTVSRIVGALSNDRQKGVPYQLIEARVMPKNRRRKQLFLTAHGKGFIKGLTVS